MCPNHGPAYSELALTLIRQMVEDLLVDDGVPSRGHRLCVLDPAYTTLGACVGEHSTLRTQRPAASEA